MPLRAAVVLLQLAGASLSSPQASTQDGRLLRHAHGAQARFENIRLLNLPRNRGGSAQAPCDARIGRYCYWYDSTQTAAVPEPKAIAEARTELLRILDSAAALDSSDGWVAGQRVRYLMEGGRQLDGVAAARACRAAVWLCAALEGLALHVAERYSEADSVFAVAMREMPAPQRCAWLDLRPMVADRLARELGRASCDERATLVERLWTLGQPLWTTPGNDLRTEHFARHTMTLIFAGSVNAYGMNWGGDSRELMVRYGWPEWFTRLDDIAGIYAAPRVTGHNREPSYYFFPSVATVRGPPRITPASWNLRDPAARTRYAPRHVARMTALPHQLARFPRGDSMLLAVAYRIADAALARDSVTSAMAVYGIMPKGLPTTNLQALHGDWGTLTATLPRDTTIVSIEARGVRSKRASRARYTVDPPPCTGSWCVSDLLLFATDTSFAPIAVENVLPRAAMALTFSNRDPLGVYWEVQGPGLTQVSLSLAVHPVGVSLPRRIASRLKLAPELAPVRLRWQATLDGPLNAQYVALRFPASARGKYVMTLTIEPALGGPIVATREIELVR